MRPLKKKKGSSHSIMALNQRRAVIDLAATLTAQGDTAAAALVKRLTPVLVEGEEMPDLELLFRLLGRHAKRAGENLDKADTGRWTAGMTLSVLRHRCQQEKAALYGVAVKVRKTLVECYGSKRCRFQFGLAARTPRGAADLAEEARRLVARLSSPELKLPPPGLSAVKVDPAGWATELLPSLTRLEGLLEEMEQRRIAAGDQVIGREKALAACEQTYLLVARTTEALFALAGEKELARRVRPPVRRRERQPARRLLPRPAAWLRNATASIWQWLRDLHQTLVWRLARGSLKARIA